MQHASRWARPLANGRDGTTIIAQMVTLSPMEPDAWEAWRAASIRGYAADKVRVAAWPFEGAEERATAMFGRIVPDGLHTRGHEFRSIVSQAGEIVGALWFAAEDEVGLGTAYIWDITIDPDHRGRGYGRDAMEALEPLARSLGYDTIRLHVFGDNAVARHLYLSVGYHETEVTMTKRIGVPGLAPAPDATAAPLPLTARSDAVDQGLASAHAVGPRRRSRSKPLHP